MKYKRPYNNSPSSTTQRKFCRHREALSSSCCHGAVAKRVSFNLVRALMTGEGSCPENRQNIVNSMWIRP